MKNFLFLVLLLAVFVLGMLGVCVALPTVDFGATTTIAQAIVNLHFNSLLDSILLTGIMVMQLLKYFFPHIDGK